MAPTTTQRTTLNTLLSTIATFRSGCNQADPEQMALSKVLRDAERGLERLRDIRNR